MVSGGVWFVLPCGVISGVEKRFRPCKNRVNRHGKPANRLDAGVGRQNFSMSSTLENQTVNTAFFQPLTGLAAASPNARACPEFPDPDYLRISRFQVQLLMGAPLQNLNIFNWFLSFSLAFKKLK